MYCHSDLELFCVQIMVLIGWTFMSYTFSSLKIKTIIKNSDNTTTISTFYVGLMLILFAFFCSVINIYFLAFYSVFGFLMFMFHVLLKIFIHEKIVPAPVSEAVPEAVSEAVSESVPEAASETVSEAVHKTGDGYVEEKIKND